MIVSIRIFQKIFIYARYIFIPFIPIYIIGYYSKRLFSKPKRFNIPIACIGNITTGGTGKTPLVLYLAKRLREDGFMPGIISRGYGGSKSEEGALVTDGEKVLISADESGDEPYLMAMNSNGIPIAIGKNKRKSIHKLIYENNSNVIVMDDGFQNNSVYKDISIVLIDATNPFGNGLLLPAGDLRETKVSLKRSAIVIINKSDLISKSDLSQLIKKIERLAVHKNVFISRYRYNFFYNINNSTIKKPISDISDKRVLLVAGIANPLSLLKGIRRYNPCDVMICSFPDHYRYRSHDITKINKVSQHYDYIITTQKDYVKINKFRLSDKFYYLPVSIEIENENLLYQSIISSLKKS